MKECEVGSSRKEREVVVEVFFGDYLNRRRIMKVVRIKGAKSDVESSNSLQSRCGRQAAARFSDQL